MPSPAASPPTGSALDAPVTLFHRVRQPKRPAETLTLREALARVVRGTYAAAVEPVRAEPDSRARQALKRNTLPVFTLSGEFSCRAAGGLVRHSGVLALDFDHVADLASLRAELEASPHVLAVFLSVSGDGLKALVPVRVVDPETSEVRLPQNDAEHKWTFTAARALFPSADADEACKDVSRACFVSDDPDVYVNEDATPVEADAPEPAARPAAKARRQGGGDPGPTEYERVRSALFAVPPRPDYPDWIRVIAAVRDAVDSEAAAVALLCEWSPEETPGEYRAKMRGGLTTVKAGTLFYLARQHGWTPPGKSPKSPLSPKSTVSPGETGLTGVDGEAQPLAPPPLPWEPFPVDLLPRAAADYTLASASAIGCDPAFVAVAVLGVLAAAVGNSHRVQIKRSWTETATLWLAVVARSGQHKSPSLHAALRPVYAREKRAADRYAREKADHDEAMSLWSALSKKGNPNAPKPIPPTRRRYRIADATVESVAVRHEENPRGLALVRDELAGFFASFDRYASGGGDAQMWIEMAEGRPVVIDRKSTDKPVTRVERPAVCVLGGTQPGVLREKLTAPLFDAGLVARLLMVEPPPSVRRFTDDDVEHGVYLAYESLVAAAYERPDEGGALPLSPEARSLFVDFYNAAAAATERVQGERLRAAFVKLDGYCARIALVLHVHDTPPGEAPGPVTLAAMARAVKLTLWFRREAARLYAAYGFHETATLDRDARLCGELPDEFRWQDVSEAWGVQKAAAYKVIARLTERGLVADEGHGRFRRFAEETVDFGDDGDFGDFPDGAPEGPTGVAVALDMALLDAAIAAGPAPRPVDPAGDGYAGDGAPVIDALPRVSGADPEPDSDGYPPVTEDPF